MSLNLNRVMFAGHIGKDPEQKFIPSGKSVVDFSIAISEYAGAGKDKKTTWINCVAWEKTGEIVVKNFGKGSPIMVEGRMEMQEYEIRDGGGKKAIAAKCVVEKVHFVGDGKKPESDANEVASQAPAPVAPKANGAAKPSAAPIRGKAAVAQSTEPAPQEWSDDVPF